MPCSMQKAGAAADVGIARYAQRGAALSTTTEIGSSAVDCASRHRGRRKERQRAESGRRSRVSRTPIQPRRSQRTHSDLNLN